MIDSSYGSTFIHRLPAAIKLSCLFCLSLLLFYFPDVWFATITLCIVYGLFLAAGFRPSRPFVELKKIMWFLIALFIVQYFSSNLVAAILICLRLSTLVLLATLVTLTTPFTKMMAFLEKFFTFTRLFGANPAKISLALSLTLRFIAVFSDICSEVREAQKARGLENNVIALVMPVLVRSLKIQADVAAAIEARSYDASETDKN